MDPLSTQRRRAAGILLGALCSLAAGALPAAEPRRGEAFTYRLSLGPIEGGRARMALAPPQRSGGRRLGSVTAEVEATGLAKVVSQQHVRYRLVYDADALLPRHLELEESGLALRTVSGELDGRKADLRTKRTQGERREQAVLPQDARDPVTAYLVLRAAPLRDGDHLDLVVFDGSTFYALRVQVEAHEVITLSTGARPAIRLRGQGQPIDLPGVARKRPPRQGTLWLSDDALRLPLRFEGETAFGAARFELSSHEGRPSAR